MTDNINENIFNRQLTDQEDVILSDLLSLSLKEFESQSELANIETHHIDAKIEAIAVGNYQSFVESSKSVQKATIFLENLKQHLL